jgi:hypothetical protein
MGKLFEKHARLFDGLIYDRDVYDNARAAIRS